MTGAVLLVLFVAECLTLLNIGNLLTLHVFLGMLLLGPVGLKIGSTLWRFTRYYTGSAAYVRKGPPAPLQRVTGAVVIVIHLASYVPKLPRMLSGRVDHASHLLAARPTRWLLLCGSLAAGLGLAFATYHLSGKFGGSPSIIP